MTRVTKAQLLREKKANLQILIQAEGKRLATANGWNLTPSEAIIRHLVNLHHWRPAEIRRLPDEDLALVLGL